MATPILYINMASRPDRRAFMERQLATLGLAAQRIEAVTPADLTAAQVQRCARLGLSPGVPCCSLSHLRALEALVAMGAQAALTLEDDAVLSSRLPEFLIACERATVDGIVRIETSFNGVRYRRVAARLDRFELVEPTNFEGGAAGYLVPASAASAVRSAIDLDIGVDEALFNPFGRLRGRARLYQTIPALVAQSHLISRAGNPSFESDINAMRPAAPAGATSLLRRLQDFYRRDIVYGTQRTFQQWLGARKHVIPFEP